MGVFDSLLQQVMGSNQDGSTRNLLGGVCEMIQNQPGGLGGLMQRFHDSGLAGVAQSWVGTGQNLPVSGDQIQQVLGNPQIQELAHRFGLDPQEVAGQISQHLPNLVDKLTPTGQVPQGDMMQHLQGLLGNLNLGGTQNPGH